MSRQQLPSTVLIIIALGHFQSFRYFAKKLISAKDRNAVDCYCCHSKFYARARISWKYINIFWISHGFEVRFHFSGFVMIFFSGASKLLLLLQFCRFWMQGTIVTFIIDFANVFKSAYSHFRAFAGTLQCIAMVSTVNILSFGNLHLLSCHTLLEF